MPLSNSIHALGFSTNSSACIRFLDFSVQSTGAAFFGRSSSLFLRLIFPILIQFRFPMMETSGGISDHYRSQSTEASGGSSRRYRVHFSPSRFIQARLSAALELFGVFRARGTRAGSEELIGDRSRGHGHRRIDASAVDGGEVSIRIVGAGDPDGLRTGSEREGSSIDVGISSGLVRGPTGRQPQGGDGEGNNVVREVPLSSSSAPASASPVDSGSSDGESNASGGNNRDALYQRYDIQQVARWIEQILPFSLLLLVVFIRQHLQGFFVTIWIAAVMFKSNDILRKQTALKNERKLSMLVGITLVFVIHILGVYWWYKNDNLLYPLVMLPPKEILPFWHALFIIMVNDTMVRQAAMVVKCILLIYYKNGRGHNYRKQGQMLTVVEYFLLLYRALLPTPVWYRFFLNKEYGSLFSSITTGLYLTFKLTSVVEKVQSFLTVIRALSRKEVHYGSYASTEQVTTAGDLCAICQEKMHAPILLSCKHIFCEDCVSEWFERERTCPLCRALVKPSDLRSFSDGSTSLFFQLF